MIDDSRLMFEMDYYQKAQRITAFGAVQGFANSLCTQFTMKDGMPIRNLIDGHIPETKKDDVLGNTVTVYHNLATIGGVNEPIFISYSHLCEFSPNTKLKRNGYGIGTAILSAGATLGNGGCSGLCVEKKKTKKETTWTQVTGTTSLGIYIHQPCKLRTKTKLFKALLKTKLMPRITSVPEQYYIWSGNRLFFAYDIILKYVQEVQNRFVAKLQREADRKGLVKFD